MLPLRSRLARALIQVLCALVLFAQQAALTHAVWHSAAGEAAQRDDAHAYPHERAPARLAGLCAYDAVFGQVLGGAFATVAAALPNLPVTQAALHSPHASSAADVLTPRSRGPPVLL